MAPRKNAAEILLKFRTDNAEGLKGIAQTQEAVKRFETAIGVSGQKISNNLYGRLAEINRSKEIDDLGRIYGEMSAKEGQAAKAADLLAEKLREIGATEDEIKKAADQFERFESAGTGGGGGGRKNTFGLRSFGSELKNLPAVALPGLGISTDAIGKITQLLGNLNPSALAAGASIGALTVALAILSNNAAKATEAAKADLNARAAAIRLLQEGNQQEIQDRINTLAKQREINAAVKADADQQLTLLREGVKQQFGLLGASIAEIDAALGTNNGELRAAKDNAEAAAKAVNETSVELDVLTRVTGLTAQTTAEAAAAERELANARLYLTTDIQNRLTADIEAYNLAQTGSSEALQSRLQQLQTEIILTENAAAQTRYRLETEQLDQKTRQELINTVDQLTMKSNALNTTMNALGQEFVRTAVAANDAAKEAEQVRQESVAAVKAYNDAVASAEQNNLKARADIQQKYNDAIVAAAETAADAAANALQKLEAQRDKLALSLSRNEATLAEKQQFEDAKRQVERQRDEVQQLQEHVAKMKQIRADAALEEEGLIAKRGFAGLYRSRRATSKALMDEVALFETERQNKLTAYAEQNTDAAAQREFERQQRLKKYQQDLADAQVAYQSDLRNAEVARSKAIQAAVRARDTEYQLQFNKYVSELNLRKTAITNDLRLIAEGNAGKLRLEQQYYAQSQAILKAALSNLNPDTSIGTAKIGDKPAQIAFKAKGGGLSKGQLAIVNEPGSTGREGFSGIAFPRGMGMFIPMQAGSVNRDTGKPSITNVWNITGNNPEQIADVVDKRIGQQLDYYFG